MSESKSNKPVSFWRKRSVVVGTGAALVLALGLSLALWLAAPLFAGPRLTALTVTGRLQHVDPAAVRGAVLPALGTGFFTTRVEDVSAAVERLPWIAEADVRREWPHTLHVDVVEEVPVARWNGDGLMDAQGRVFVQDSDKAYSVLPLLNGRDGSEQDVLAQYNTLASLVASRGLVITALTVDARGAATVVLNDGVEVRLGREDAEARLERFSAVALPALGAKLTTVAYVDMRYTNGFAVGWKTPGGEHAKQGA
ncbi:MAG TPA: cell division protein FtsQ/DivIB [Gammaproteobacteria bacterium]|nr:cell division protein FtsQ/DivIB [Gammaproteobacteria bacterium]